MWNILIYLYSLNSLFLINHEIDSAYWKEWNLFGLKGGMNGFLAFNFVAVAFLIYGLIELVKQSFIGLIFSFLVGIIGIFTFSIHMFFLIKGRKEFKVFFSIFILFSILILSLIQIMISLKILL